MIIKNKLRQISNAGLAVSFLAFSLLSTLTLLLPHASAVTTSSISTVYGDPAIKCAPSITALGGFPYSIPVFKAAGQSNVPSELSRLAAGSVSGVGNTAASKAVFKDLSDLKAIPMITFKAANGATNNNDLCAGSLVFFRQLEASDQNTFYGIWSCPAAFNNTPLCARAGGGVPTYRVVTGTVDPKAKTLTFGLPDGTSGTVLLAQTDNALTNPNIFTQGSTTGAGNAGGGVDLATCIVANSHSGIQKPCLDPRSNASFTDWGHISYDGNVYVAGQWGGGDHMYYTLVATSKNAKLASLSPRFDINTHADQTDFNIDDAKDPQQLSQLKDALNRTGGKRQTIDITFQADGTSGNVTTNMSGVHAVADYYPDSKDASKDYIELVFTSAGGNESHFLGKYTRADDKSTTFTLAGAGYSGCGTTLQPRFVLGSNPRTKGAIAPANWSLQANSTPCQELAIPVTVHVQAMDAVPPTAPTKSVNTDNAASGPSCEAHGTNLSWILCPIIDIASHAIQSIYNNMIQPLLVTKAIDITNNPADPTHTFQIWSNFRLIGDIFLVAALIIVVYAQSIGGGMLDAYTAKKMLPRLLIAGILINTSIYLVALAVDISNVVGNGIAALLEAPFKSTPGGFKIQLSGLGSDVGMGAIIAGGVYAWFAGAALIEFMLVFMLVPGFLIFIAILATVVLRRGLILLLIVLAPVAFALYCLPNTEKYFRQWWDTLFKTLLVYPIIAVLFALGNIMSVTINLAVKSGDGGASAAVADLLSIAALFVPLFLIPFSFKLAGGILGRAHDALQTAGKRGSEFWKGNQNDPFSRRNQARYKLGDRNTLMRERAVDRGSAEGAGIGRRTIGRAANWGNLQAKRSMYNKQRSEMLQGQINTGDDSNIRDLFIAWDSTGGKDGSGAWYRRMDMENGHRVAGASAVYEGTNARQRGQIAKNKSMSLYKGDKSAVQDALYYEWKKTSFEPSQMGRIGHQYGEILAEHGFNEGEGAGMMKGVTFRHQGQSLAGKHSTYKKQDDGSWGWKTDHMSLTKEGSLNIGTYGWSNQDVSTFDELSSGYNGMSQVLGAEGIESKAGFGDQTVIRDTGTEYDGKTRDQVANARKQLIAMAETLNPSRGSSAQGRVDTVGEDGPQITGMGGVSGAPVRVQEAARNFHRTVFGGTDGDG
ncbi:MAG: hypothetical protein JWO41_143 [Candidatus Saccharibacteria bacterium]|nr:hypothetical protein [Candidatus Saccharibacteria bacterium]